MSATNEPSLGPWAYRGGMAVRDADGRAIAWVLERHAAHLRHPEPLPALANGRLLALAWEMHELLELLVRRYDGAPPSVHNLIDTDARALLRRAKGG